MTDQNPYTSPTTSTATALANDEQQEKRRYRVAWMWGASGCGYLALPWWLPLGVAGSCPPVMVLLALGLACVAIILSLIVLVAAIGVARLGRPLDILGAGCGLLFGTGLIAGTAVEMLFVIVIEHIANP